MDAASERYDGQSTAFNLDTAFDSSSVRWYREVYEGRPGNRSHVGLSDPDFLNEMGLLVEEHGRLLPSRAAILLFGTNATFRQLLPRPVVDCQRYSLNRDRADTGERWIDRRVLDENLIRTWQALVDWYQRLADQPFRVDPSSLQRDDSPPDYRAFRESMVNLLIHQDYADHSRKAEIRHYADQTVFWNPGDAFATDADLLEPGEKEVRNPRIVTAFRRIGLSENAGWGLRDVFRNWQQLGHVPPIIDNGKGRKYFELILRKEELLSEQQVLFQARLGVQLTREQARVFAVGCREKAVTIPQIKAITGLAGPDAIALADALVTKVLFRTIEAGRTYALAEHLTDHAALTDQADDITGNLVTDQADAVTGRLVSDQPQGLQSLTENQWKIVMLCDVPRSVVDLDGRTRIDKPDLFPTPPSATTDTGRRAPNDASGAAEPSGPSLCADRGRPEPQGPAPERSGRQRERSLGMARRTSDRRTKHLFRDGSGQDDMFEKSYEEELEARRGPTGRVPRNAVRQRR